MSSHIYRGSWVNWSQGPVVGATLTLGQRDGGLLTAFIATFVTVVGSQLWKIISYTFHQLKASNAAQDGLHHQQQIILRNEGSPTGALWKFLQQAWCWRNKANKVFLRTIPLALFSAFFFALFTVLAVFSSEISKGPGSARLVVSDQCGYWRLNSTSTASQNAWSAKTRDDSQNAALYVQQCYGGDTNPLQCSRYPVSSLKRTSDRNATCPFESGACFYGDKAAFEIKSEMIDSNYGLGINAPSSDRLQYQKITTCAPIHAKGFGKIVNGSTSEGIGWDGDTVVLYYYGPITRTDGSNVTDWTLQYNKHATIDNIGYTLEPLAATPRRQPEDGGWQPIEALSRTDADLSLLFISPNSLSYTTPNGDPVFGANQRGELRDGVPYWTTDAYVSVLGCAEQHRICNPTTGSCTDPLDSLNVVEAAESKLALNPAQKGVVARLGTVIAMTSIFHATYSSKQNSLLAQRTVANLEQGPLPSDQWMLEVGSWFDEGLARLQQGIQEYASGPASSIIEGSYLLQPNDAVSKAMCYSQIIHDSSDTLSFSVLGMIILFVIGGLIIIASYTVDILVGYIQKRFNTGLHARTSWLADDKLQVHKLLFRELNRGNWTTSIEDFPTTIDKSKFNGTEKTVVTDNRFSDKIVYTRVSVTEQPEPKV